MTSQRWTETATGFAAAWLAFSGLESLGQLAPALREPRRRVHPHRRGAGRRQPGGHGAGVHASSPSRRRRRARSARSRRCWRWSREAYGGRALLVAVSLTGAGLPAGRRQRRVHRLLQRVQGGRRARLPAGGAGRAPQALRHAARRDRRHHGGDGAAGDHDRRRAVPRWARCSRSACSGRTRSRRSAWCVIAWREKRRGLPLIIDGIASLALLVPWVTSWFTKPISTLYGVAGHRVAAGGRVRHPPGLDPVGALRLPARRLGRAGGRGAGRRRTRW